MDSGGDWTEIIIFAAIAAFVAWRLYAVLGRRTGHERPPVGDVFRGPATAEPPTTHRPLPDVPVRRDIELPPSAPADVQAGLRAVAEADPTFVPQTFLDGARQAYGLVLEAFWAGDALALKPFVSDDVFHQFASAIAQRDKDGLTLENRIVDIYEGVVLSAGLDGAMAEIAVRFDAKITSITRRGDQIVAGSASEELQVHDVWTFRRHTRSADPAWLLVATDDEE
jgi:predicted lipid-binding transport protein (Tim44 family)